MKASHELIGQSLRSPIRSTTVVSSGSIFNDLNVGKISSCSISEWIFLSNAVMIVMVVSRSFSDSSKDGKRLSLQESNKL